ncbi:hypothetical protein CAAN1_11S00540 [[Candida] anglica]|uniref:Uncharacterized protein n=1 Tax=[Candida] anglica TaxID=148631 RepID=A0ABP0EIA5_9ASCO
MSIEQLSEQVRNLTAIVEKQSQIIAQTGQQVLDLQVKDVKSKMNSMDIDGGKPSIDVDDFVTNEDIVQLVGELQGQLDFLEDRGIKRVINSTIDKTDLRAIIAPLTNRDGELPNNEIFPNTVDEFLNISPPTIILLCEFYELINNNNDESLQKLLESGAVSSIEEAHAVFQQQQSESLEDKLKAYTPQQLDIFVDELARYLGLRFRKQKSVW